MPHYDAIARRLGYVKKKNPTIGDVVRALDAAGLDLEPHVRLVERLNNEIDSTGAALDMPITYAPSWFDALLKKLRAMPLERLPAVMAAIEGR
jgi:hypothetical protein